MKAVFATSGAHPDRGNEDFSRRVRAAEHTADVDPDDATLVTARFGG